MQYHGSKKHILFTCGRNIPVYETCSCGKI